MSEVAPLTGSSPEVALIRREDALRRGLNADDIKRRVARGEWTVLRPGMYVRTSGLAMLTPERRHLLRVAATTDQIGDRSVVSHLSAACLHGIELARVPDKMVQVTKPTTHAGHRRRRLQTYCATVDPDEIVVVDGHRVTTVARTVVDLARTCGFEQAVVAADFALREGLVDRDQLQASAERSARRSGIRVARQVIEFADPGAQSVGESRSRVLMARQDLPPPELQSPIVGRTGEVFARSDFRWREYNTVGEFDGAEKYGRLLRPGARAGDVIFQEKIREDRIRDLGLNVVRWTWEELAEPRPLADKIRRALDRGRGGSTTR